MKLNQQLLIVIRYLRCADDMLTGEESGEISINNGSVSMPGDYIAGEWISISGSRLNDGIYVITGAESEDDGGIYLLGNGTDDESVLRDEPPFAGLVLRLRIDNAFLELIKEIMDFESSAGKTMPYTSETVIGLHSWTKGQKADGTPIGWAEIYKDRLAPYRRMFTEVKI